MITRKRCSFCQHEEREELEAAIEQGAASCDDLDSRNGWRSGTTAQHQRNHMGEYTNSTRKPFPTVIYQVTAFLKP